MANMDELLIAHILRESLISLAVCMSIVSTVCMPAAAAQTLNLLVLLRKPHPSMQIKHLLELATAMATSSLCRIYHQAMTKNRPCLSLHSMFGQQASRNAWRFAPLVQECISMATLVCAYVIANLPNCGPSELIKEYIFYALQVRIQTI